MKRILLLTLLLSTVLLSRAQFTLVGDAIDLGGGCFQIADTNPPAVGPTDWQSAVWNNTLIDLNAGFDIKLYVSMTAEPADSYFAADGMAFVLQNTGTGALAVASGNTLGYAHTPPIGPCPAVPPFAGGITPSIAVELDVFNNNGDCVIDGPDYDHISLVQDGNFAAPLAGPVKAMALQNEISGAGPNEYRCREFRISYEPVNDTLKIWYDGVLIGRRKQDLVATVFGGNPMVYWGFTAATGFIGCHIVVCTEYVDAGPDASTCNDGTASFNASGAASYTWSPAAGLSCTNCANPTYTPGTAGIHGYQVVGTNFAGCRDIDSVFVEVFPDPIVDAGPTPGPICPGGSAALNGSITGTDIDFSWSPSGSLSSGTSLTPTASPLATTTYTLTATDTVTGCSATDVVTVTVAPGDSAEITLPDPTTICSGDSVVITTTATAGIDTYDWSPPGSLSSSTAANPTAFPSSTTTYYLTASSSTSGCLSVDSVTIVVADLVVGGLGDQELCEGQTYCDGPIAATGAVGPVSFIWTLAGDTLSTADTICTPPVNGADYILTVTDLLTGCTDSDTAHMVVSSIIVQASPSSASINPGQLIEVTAQGGESWLWTGGTFNCDTCVTTLATSTTPGTITFTVTGTDSVGCQGTATITLVVEPYLVPNVFTPNGDGINDVVDLNYLGSDKHYEFTILDRWGNTIMTTNDPAQVWNGKTSGGSDAPEGVYFIAVRIIGDIGIEDAQKNSAFQVTLVR
jgi:gliding motility-associated-like protein